MHRLPTAWIDATIVKKSPVFSMAISPMTSILRRVGVLASQSWTLRSKVVQSVGTLVRRMQTQGTLTICARFLASHHRVSLATVQFNRRHGLRRGTAARHTAKAALRPCSDHHAAALPGAARARQCILYVAIFLSITSRQGSAGGCFSNKCYFLLPNNL